MKTLLTTAGSQLLWPERGVRAQRCDWPAQLPLCSTEMLRMPDFCFTRVSFSNLLPLFLRASEQLAWVSVIGSEKDDRVFTSLKGKPNPPSLQVTNIVMEDELSNLCFSEHRKGFGTETSHLSLYKSFFASIFIKFKHTYRQV